MATNRTSAFTPTTRTRRYCCSCTARRWYDALKAPRKEWAWFEDSAHSPIKEEPEAWNKAVFAFLDSLDLK